MCHDLRQQNSNVHKHWSVESVVHECYLISEKLNAEVSYEPLMMIGPFVNASSLHFSFNNEISRSVCTKAAQTQDRDSL